MWKTDPAKTKIVPVSVQTGEVVACPHGYADRQHHRDGNEFVLKIKKLAGRGDSAEKRYQEDERTSPLFSTRM